MKVYETRTEAESELSSLRGWPGSRAVQEDEPSLDGVQGWYIVTGDGRYFCGCGMAVRLGMLCTSC